MASRRIIKIKDQNIAEKSISSLRISAADASPEELTNLLKTDQGTLKALALLNGLFPQDWGNIVALDSLSLYCGDAEEIPVELFNISIKSLHIGGLNIKKLPESLWQIKGLENLGIHCKSLVNKEKSEWKLPHLRNLNLQTPHFDFENCVLPEKLQNLQNLTILSNNLKEIPNAFKVSGLQSVNFKCAAVQHFPSFLADLKELNQLIFIGEKLKGPIPNLSNFSRSLQIESQEELDFSNTKIEGSDYLTLKTKQGTKSFPKINKCHSFLRIDGFDLSEESKSAILRLHSRNITFSSCANIDLKYLSQLRDIQTCIVGSCNLLPFDYQDLKSKTNIKNLTHGEEELTITDTRYFELDRKPKKYRSTGVTVINAHFPDPTILVTKKIIGHLKQQHFLHFKKFDKVEKSINIIEFGRTLARATKIKEVDKKRLFMWFWERGGELFVPPGFRDRLLLHSINHPEMSKIIWEETIEPLFQRDKKVAKGNRIFINGNPKMKKAEIIEKSAETGLVYEKKLSKSVTYMILCEKPQVVDFAPKDYTIIGEDQLKDFLQSHAPGFLVTPEADPVMIENIMQFLNSMEASNQVLGLKMIETGGLPEELFERVLIMAKCANDAKVRNAAKRVIKTYGKGDFIKIVELSMTFKKKGDILPFSNRFKIVEQKLGLRLTFELNYLLYKYDMRNLRYILCHKNPDLEILEKSVQLIIQKYGKLNMGHAIGNYYDIERGFIIAKKNTVVTYFHPNFPTGGYIQHLDLRACRFRKFPIEILRFKAAKHLDLRNNYIKAIPKEITQMKNLKVLDLRNNPITRLPDFVKNIEGLEIYGDSF